jgi:hypothetical protein
MPRRMEPCRPMFHKGFCVQCPGAKCGRLSYAPIALDNVVAGQG